MVAVLGPKGGLAAEAAAKPMSFTGDMQVEIKGLCPAVAGVQVVQVGGSKFEKPKARRTIDRTYRPWPTRAGGDEDRKFFLVVPDVPANAAVLRWAKSAVAAGPTGKARLQRNISVSLLARDKKTVLRTINCFGCFPVSCDGGDQSTGSDIKTLTLTCTVDRIEVA